MIYQLYKIKNESLSKLHDRLFVYDIRTGHILYLWIEHNTDYFKIFLDWGVPWYTNLLIDRIKDGFLELENYDLIEEFESPKDSIVLRQIYEDILFIEELGK